MRVLREIAGYVTGGVVFVLLLPFLMWLCSGKVALWPVGTVQLIASILLATAGLVLSIWAIVYMRHKGDGNPMDAFGHEMAPRTQHLMTDGPYRLSRNPMLIGIFLYLIGIIVWLWTWQPVVFFIVFVVIMLLQVRSEEKRLLRDFGEEYKAYCKKTGRFLTK